MNYYWSGIEGDSLQRPWRQRLLPVAVVVAHDTVLHGFLHLVDDGIGVSMCHYQGLGAGALLGIFLHEGVVLGNLPLLVLEEIVGLVVGLAF